MSSSRNSAYSLVGETSKNHYYGLICHMGDGQGAVMESHSEGPLLIQWLRETSLRR